MRRRWTHPPRSLRRACWRSSRFSRLASTVSPSSGIRQASVSRRVHDGGGAPSATLPPAEPYINRRSFTRPNHVTARGALSCSLQCRLQKWPSSIFQIIPQYLLSQTLHFKLHWVVVCLEFL